MEIKKKKSLDPNKQIDRMVNEGLGAGRIFNEKDQQKVTPEQSLPPQAEK